MLVSTDPTGRPALLAPDRSPLYDQVFCNRVVHVAGAARGALECLSTKLNVGPKRRKVKFEVFVADIADEILLVLGVELAGVERNG